MLTGYAAAQARRDAQQAQDPTLALAEWFGSTFQGEGPSTGRTAFFIRTGGCNLHCSWCDTPFTWDASRFDLRTEIARVAVPVVVRAAAASGASIAVITGGEPLLHQRQPGWGALLDGLAAAGMEIEVETNGTLRPAPHTQERVTRFNVSPKLAHAGDPVAARIRAGALRALVATGNASFKFVARDVNDLDEIQGIVDAVNVPQGRVWVMPEGTTAETVLARARALADPVLARGWNLTTRLHVLLWNDERSR